ncbi:uncharacterized protein LOC127585805 [Pristis pectinata]|uniref:uncharacterized protein LOC127585805 n=1 Tax=Pristis pectinata TaxID=685728 RepID=UPI00223CFB71|nr:uncharacterized protein LOC127585805 [Pristis pectinata]
MWERSCHGILFLSCCLQTVLSVKFHVVGPKVSPIVSVGEDVLLECRTEPNTSLKDLEVRWFKNDFSTPVHLYSNGHDQPTKQDVAYKDRTELFKQELSHGNASLKLKKINANDDGEYKCFIDFKQDYDETKVLLKVGGMGQQPLIHLEGIHQQGVRLVCKSDGWYPVPTVYWLNGNGENVTGQSVTTQKDQSSGLFAVSNQIDVTSDSVNRYSCLMINNVLNKEEGAQLQLSGVFFPKINAWMVAFCVFLILVIGAIIFEVFHHRRKREKVKELKLFCTLEGYNDQEINDVSVTLNEETANPKLELKNQTSVRLTNSEQNRPDTGKRFTELESVLGQDEFRSGRYYWVTEVAMNQNWCLGVATESVEKKGRVELTPENGFWTIQRDGDEFIANDSTPVTLTTKPIPEKLGIYLSYESGRISFHNVATKTCVHTFTVDKFKEKLYPFFRTGDVDKWVKMSSGSALDLHKEPRPQATLKTRVRRMWNRIHQHSQTELFFLPPSLKVLSVNMASAQQDESLTEDLTCPICLYFFTDPVSLECGHNFCRSCITQSWEKKEKNYCPECGEEFAERNLRSSRALANLSEKARKLNLKTKEKGNKLLCEEHREELKLFCETDKKLICYTCRDAREHREHRFMPVNEAVEIYKGVVISSLDSVTKKKLAILEMEHQQREKISEIRDQSQILQKRITSEFSEMYQFLTEKEKGLIADLQKEKGELLEKMEKNLLEIQERSNSIQEELLKLREQVDQKDGMLFLKEESWRNARIKDESQELSVKDGTLNVTKFKGPFLKIAWKEMLDALNPAPVTLDVETANPRLEVSKDLTSVRLSGTWNSVPDTGKRFSDWACALGSEGFTSGRHFWEVEVAGNRIWSLGVAAESVERKGWVGVIPENGFWTIGRVGDGFYVNTSPGFPLPANPIPGRVGVCLSYESGTVSFYNADTKSHLHTFTGNKFTEKLYPFFWTGDENKWLRICSISAPDL